MTWIRNQMITRRRHSFSSDSKQFGNSCAGTTAFTLLELLVVISIVVVLLTLLFPVANKIYETGLSAKCISNLRNVGAAIRLSASDNDGKWVIVDEARGLSPWYNVLLDGGYIDSGNCFSCPAWDPKKFIPPFTYGASWNGIANSPDNQGIMVRNYDTASHVTYYAIKLMAISKPGAYLLMADSYTSRAAYKGLPYPIIQGNGSADEIHLRHAKKANVLFADGHVSGCSTNNLAEIGWHKAFNKAGDMLTF